MTTVRKMARHRPEFLAAARWLSAAIALAGGLPVGVRADPALGVDDSGLAFTGRIHSAVADRAIAVTNTGTGTLDYTLASDVFWLSVTNAAGSLPAGASTTHVVRVATRGLVRRTYTGALLLTAPTAPNSPRSIPVSLTLTSPAPPTVTVAWGNSSHGLTNVPAHVTNAVAAVAGNVDALALLANGTLISWGSNAPPAGLTGVVAIAAGFPERSSLDAYGHCLALTAGGEIVAWGMNRYAQTNVPAEAGNAIAIAAGAAYSLAVRTDGRVVGWGLNDYGQIDVPAHVTNAVAVTATRPGTSFALLANGRVAAWGYNAWGVAQVPAQVTNAVAVAASEHHALALLADGTVVAWGISVNGQCSVPSHVTNAVAVAATDNQSLALLADGSIARWGSGSYDLDSVASELRSVFSLSAGVGTCLAVAESRRLTIDSPHGFAGPSQGAHTRSLYEVITARVDAAVSAGTTQYVCTGWTGSGSVPATGSSNAVALTLTNDTTIAWQWSTNFWLDAFNLGGGDLSVTAGWRAAGSLVEIAASPVADCLFLGWRGDTNGCTIAGDRITLPLKQARRIWAEFTGPVIVASPGVLGYTGLVNRATIVDNWVTISNAGTGALHCEIASDGFWLTPDTAWASLTTGESTRVRVRVATRGLRIGTHSGRISFRTPYALNGTQSVDVSTTLQPPPIPSVVTAWGDNSRGQTDVPANLTNAIDLAGGGFHSLALLHDRRVAAWGFNSSGQTAVPAHVTNVVEVAAGTYHSAALLSNGCVSVWGDFTYDQPNVPAGVTGVVHIAAGGDHMLALLSDGRVAGWGRTSHGQTTPPALALGAAAVAARGLRSGALLQNGSVIEWGAGIPSTAMSVSNAVAISLGIEHSLALLSNGTVLAWGENSHGQTDVPPAVTNAVAVEAGDYHSTALLADGTLVAWGLNTSGQTLTPTGLRSPFDTAGGANFGLAVEEARPLTVASPHGAPIPPAGLHHLAVGAAVPAAVDAVVAAGTTQFICVGWTGSGSVPAVGSSNAIAFTLTNETTLDWRWATNYWIETSNLGGGDPSVTSGWHAAGTSVQIRADPIPDCGFLGWTGDTNECAIAGALITVPVDGARRIRAEFTGPSIAASQGVLSLTGRAGRVGTMDGWLALTNSGTGILRYGLVSDRFWLATGNATGMVLASGASTQHAVTVSTRGLRAHTHFARIVVQAQHATNDGLAVPVSLTLTSPPPPTVTLAWGDSLTQGTMGVPAALTNAVEVACGKNHSVARLHGGRCIAWAPAGVVQPTVPANATNVVGIAAGDAHTLAVLSDGQVLAWGSDTGGQSTVPPEATHAITAAAGRYHSLILQADGRIAGWGSNGAGQLGMPPHATNAVAIAAYANRSMALMGDGRTVAWGSTNASDGVPAAADFVGIAIGCDHYLALSKNGRVTAWGGNSHGQTNVPPHVTNAVAVAAGEYHSLAVLDDGSITVWGAGYAGQTNVPHVLRSAFLASACANYSVAVAEGTPLDVASAHGTSVPSAGTHIFCLNSPVTASVDAAISIGSTQHTCAGWTGSGSVPASGLSNAVPFTLAGTSAIAWQWATNYWLDIANVGGGDLDIPSGWRPAGSTVDVTATPIPDCQFVGWRGDTNGCSIVGDRITVPADGARRVWAEFTGPVIVAMPSASAFTGTVFRTDSFESGIVVSNAGVGTMEFALGSDRFWISTGGASGTLAPGASTQLSYRVVTRGLKPRLHRGNVLIHARHATHTPFALPVTLALRPPTPTLMTGWGYSWHYQTVIPSNLTTAVSVAAGRPYTIVQLADGRVTAWGDNGQGETNIPAHVTNTLAIATRSSTVAAVLSNGTIAVWGAASQGQTNIPAAATNIVEIAVGDGHLLALAEDGHILAWGRNDHGQAVVPPAATGAVAVAAGHLHSLALLSDGRVIAWGTDASGQATVPATLTGAVAIAAGADHSVAVLQDGKIDVWGLGGNGERNVPAHATNAVSVAAGVNGTCAILDGGGLATWGSGFGVYYLPHGLRSVFAVGPSDYHVFAISEARGLTVASDHGAPQPSAAAHRLCAHVPLEAYVDATVTAGSTQFVCGGWNGSGSVPASGSSNAVAFTLAADSTLAWRWTTNFWMDANRIGGGDLGGTSAWHAAGSLVRLTATARPSQTFLGWRGDTNGCAIAADAIDVPMDGARSIRAEFTSAAIACEPASLVFTGRVATASTMESSLTVRNEGTGLLHYSVESDVFWLSTDSSTGTLASGASTQCTVRVASRGLKARPNLGRIVVRDPHATNSPLAVPVTLVMTTPAPPTAAAAWGADTHGQSGVPLGASNLLTVAAGNLHTLALTTERQVLGWGDDLFGKTGCHGTGNAVAIAAGQEHSIVVLADGTLRCWGLQNFQAPPIPLPDGTYDNDWIWWWPMPWLIPPSDITNAIDAACGPYHTLALLEDRRIRAWGVTHFGMTAVPADVTNAIAVTAGGWHSVALLADGRPRGWGQNYHGQSDTPADVTHAVAVAAGAGHTVVLLSDGRVRAWGLNDAGQCDVPVQATNAVAVAAGGSHSLALLEDGRVLGWGLDESGQATPPDGFAGTFAIAAGGAHSVAACQGVMHRLTVSSQHGSSAPQKTTGIVHDLQTTLRMAPVVASQTQYACVGWAGAGSVPAMGISNTVTFPMTDHSELTWLWTTNYVVWLISHGSGTLVPDRHGTKASDTQGSMPGATNGWHALGATLTVTGAPSAWHHFTGWSGDLPEGQGLVNPLVLSIDRPRAVIAGFAPNLAPRGTPEHWIAAHGLTNQPFDLAEMDDRDGDGRPAWEEFTADTDPTNAASVFEISSLSFLGDVLAIGIRGGTGAAICVEVSTNMVATAQDWIPVAQLLPPMPPTNTCYAPAFTPLPIIYRVRAWRP